jgi:hypothetical protein
MVPVMMADENGVDAIPGFGSRQQCGFDFSRHALVGIVFIMKQRVEHDPGVTALDHGTHVGDVGRSRAGVVCRGRQGQEATEQQAYNVSSHRCTSKIAIFTISFDLHALQHCNTQGGN